MNSTTVFRDYGQKALDAQYNNRARVPEHQDIYAGYQARAAGVVEKFETRLDVSYGPSAEETLDVYLPENTPENAQGAPINVFLHGGYWFSRHKNDFRFLAQGLTRAGAVLVIVNYALVPSVDLDELVRQCRAAVAWTHGNADTFGGDKERIFVSGHSAGGHLTAMMMATEWPAFAGGLGGVSGYRLRLNAAARNLQLLRGEETLVTVPQVWQPGAWTNLRFRAEPKGEAGAVVSAKVWFALAAAGSRARCSVSDASSAACKPRSTTRSMGSPASTAMASARQRRARTTLGRFR